jgi:hypothetical protein
VLSTAQSLRGEHRKQDESDESKRQRPELSSIQGSNLALQAL